MDKGIWKPNRSHLILQEPCNRWEVQLLIEMRVYSGQRANFVLICCKCWTKYVRMRIRLGQKDGSIEGINVKEGGTIN